MSKYEVIGDIFPPDSPSLEKKKPPYFESALENSEFAPEGFGVSVNYSRDELVLKGGYARLYDGSQLWHIFVDGDETIDLESGSGVTYFFVAYDIDQDQLYYEVNSTDTAPSDPSLKILEVDAGTQTESKHNREAIIGVGATVYNNDEGSKQAKIKYDPKMDIMVLIKYD